ncbi:saccharopine dehydrogenase NADP-binding domain-containing protein [Legionella bozemanae]|uniref:Adenosylhomocysteinase n=1 Tax=Legionella bozemanae TaxID=447 RepID=A0A0W0RSP6_LEGBO|nr:saccharopine dehydrogenase NADP-binding domain-containing protein [Legionella bozemanae]KTC74064.1 adenosylhomocysteinase [Legionella bozemanae]STO33655.1 Adenosylhomocysteinase [Legionella bozemanae]
MQDALKKFFQKYPQAEAPFMHEQLAEWSVTRPLTGLRVLHHVPVVTNTLLKIACLLEAGADVTITNPTDFCYAHPHAVSSLNEAKIRYVEDPRSLVGETFDLYFDCGAQLYQFLGKPQIGAIELTGSGDQFYRQQTLNFPVISVDRTLTKQLETVFGCAESSHMALAQLTGINTAETSWIIFGFGKIGRGLAYFCSQNKVPVVVVDPNKKQRNLAQNLGIKAIDPQDFSELERALIEANVVVTATGQKAIMSDYPHFWFSGKILANLGIYDEFGPHFSDEEVLNHKMPVNFVLNDPTPMKYIDPEFYIHNLVALMLLKEKLTPGVHGISSTLDHSIIERWCAYHSFPLDKINAWLYL